MPPPEELGIDEGMDEALPLEPPELLGILELLPCDPDEPPDDPEEPEEEEEEEGDGELGEGMLEEDC